MSKLIVEQNVCLLNISVNWEDAAFIKTCSEYSQRSKNVCNIFVPLAVASGVIITLFLRTLEAQQTKTGWLDTIATF